MQIVYIIIFVIVGRYIYFRLDYATLISFIYYKRFFKKIWIKILILEIRNLINRTRLGSQNL